jgi:hypothetical protein
MVMSFFDPDFNFFISSTNSPLANLAFVPIHAIELRENTISPPCFITSCHGRITGHPLGCWPIANHQFVGNAAKNKWQHLFANFSQAKLTFIASCVFAQLITLLAPL